MWRACNSQSDSSWIFAGQETVDFVALAVNWVKTAAWLGAAEDDELRVIGSNPDHLSRGALVGDYDGLEESWKGC